MLPSFCVLLLISLFLDRFLEIGWVANAFRGIKAAVGILIVDAALRMFRKMKKKPLPVLIAAFAFLAMLAGDVFAVHISSVTLMLIAAAVSLALFPLRRRFGKAGGCE